MSMVVALSLEVPALSARLLTWTKSLAKIHETPPSRDVNIAIAAA